MHEVTLKIRYLGYAVEDKTFFFNYMIIVEKRYTKVRFQQMTFVHDHRDYRSYDMLFSFHDVELFLWICESTKIRATPTFSTYFYIPHPAK